jgi:hypothetical protein
VDATVCILAAVWLAAAIVALAIVESGHKADEALDRHETPAIQMATVGPATHS